MKTSRPHLVVLSALLAASLLAACQRAPKRNILKINIVPGITHVAVGHSARLAAYQEYRLESNDPDAVSAATDGLHHETVAARWSVSDARLASVNEDGTLTALKPGRVTIMSNWESFEASKTIEVVRNLPVDSLPQLSSRATQCVPQSIALSLEADRTIHFQLGFNEGGCRDLELTATAPDQMLPWEFETNAGRLELTSARGPIINGAARLPGGGEISFNVWVDGAGAFPVSLAGKSVLLVGDSMAEGIGPYLQKKVEASGGRFINGQERSSTIIWWQGSGKLQQLLGQYHPDIVFIALGSNEIFLEQPEARAPLIKEMVAELGTRPAFWIGPPSWKPDKGLVHVIDENFQPDHFYNSNDLKVPRAPDGKHPTAQGYQTWTELIWNWYARAI
jgi:lysophospholipase L1-like esterase